MPTKYFIFYKGLCYDVGTKLKFKAYSGQYPYKYYLGIKKGKIEKFIGSAVFIKGDDGELYKYSTIENLVDFDNIIVEIIRPVYYIPENQADGRERPVPWDIETGWIWYIIIMTVGIIFKDRITIWVFTSIIFFLWKNGFLNGGK